MQKSSLSRRKFLQLSAAFAGTAALAACVPAQPGAAPAGGQSASSPSKAQVTLTTAHAWEAAFIDHQKEFDNNFKAKHPDIADIQITNNTWADHNKIVPTWAAANTLPDIIYVHGRYAFPWNHEGILIPVSDFIDKDADFNIKGIWQEALRLYQFNGKQYEIPYDHGPVILGYNKDLFDAAKVDYPNENWTWDNFLEAAKKLTKEDKQWGFDGYYDTIVGLGNEQGIGLVGPWGGSVFNDTEDKILLDSPESTAAFKWWADLIHVHKVAPLPAQSQAVPNGPWVAGTSAMFGLASWGTPTLIQNAKFKWDVAPWPKGPKARITGSFGSGYGITRDSKHPDAAWSYLHDYLSKDGMEFMWGKSGRGSPARKDAYDSWLTSKGAPEHAKYYKDALESYAVTGHPYQTLAGGEILDIFNRNTQLIQTGDMKVEDAIAAIIKDGTPVLQDAAKKLKGG